MGCGSSKSVAVASNGKAGNAPAQKVVVNSTSDTKTVDEPSATSTPQKTATASTTTKNDAKRGSTGSIDAVGEQSRKNHSPKDSGLEEAGIITEDTAGGEEIAGKDRPATPELMVSGGKPAVRNTHVQDSDAENDDPLVRDTSAASVRSAPTILQRPSSRGGSAFDISFEEEQSTDGGNNTPRLPRRLRRLEDGSGSGRKKRADLTLEELQAKLAAAETRRKEYEQRLKEKMQQETKKAESYVKSANTSLNDSVEKTQTDAQEKEKQALENREAHLKQLREKLKAKDDRAKAVREKKRLIQQQSPSAPALSVGASQ